MNPTQFLSRFDRISEAPDAIPRLRRFILDLAVRGKLVEQDPRDEPASELLKRIQAEKERLVKEGKIRAPRELEASDEQDVPFPLPTGWAWCKLSEIGAIIGGGTPSSGDPDNFTDGGLGVAWLTPADLGKRAELYVSHGARDLTQQGLRSSSATLMPKGSVLFTSRAPIGYTAIAANEVSTNQGFKSVVPYILDCNLYVAVYFRAFAKWIDGKASGTTFREVSGKIVGNLPFPLPPLAEQHRIVAKVDELMALCDRLEAAQAERESRRDRLVASSLNRLNNGAEADAFREHARFYFNHLPRLTTRPEHIQRLRQTILNLAVRGQLVPQDPNDEPASELLKRIQAEKKRIAQAGEIRNEKSLPLVTRENVPFDLPMGWEWTRWDTIALKIGDIDHKMPETVADGIPYISPRDFLPGNRIDFDGAKRVSLDDFDRLSKKIKPIVGDLIYPRYGTIGENRLVTDRRDFLVSYSCALIKVLGGFIDSKYQYLYSISPYSRQQAKAAENKTTQANVGIKSIQEFLFPLPPLAEQHRIVAKVDELMALCDRLEAQLTTTQTESRLLLEAVLHEALAPAV